MKFYAVHDLLRQRINLYCELGVRDDGVRLFAVRESPLYDRGPVQEVTIGSEPPLWDWFPDDAVGPLAEALAPRPVATERHLDDALTVRDRLLSLFEAQPLFGIHQSDRGGVHIADEAELRRESVRKAR